MDTLQLGLDAPERKDGKEPVECLGRIFESDQARREYYLALLAEKLTDPEFRKVPGFPSGTDEAILRMSDPPYYTACPNPFLNEFVQQHGRPYDSREEYHREPFAVDVSVGKTDPLYKAHSYHTKVPHLAIVPSILHYTKPGDIILDGFCGSGMTGIAAQWCGSAPAAYRTKLEAEWKAGVHLPPEWGTRRVILGDLSPVATFISANYNIPFNVEEFSNEARRILSEVMDELGWMYETLHTDGKTKGRINYTIWSEVFSCPTCSGEVVFLQEALDESNGRIRTQFPCIHCGTALTKARLDRRNESWYDTVLGQSIRRSKHCPIRLNYSVGDAKFEKNLTEKDRAILAELDQFEFPQTMPTDRMMHTPPEKLNWGDKYRAGTASFSHIHHLFQGRSARSLALLWDKSVRVSDQRIRNILLFLVEQSIWSMSILNRYLPTAYSQVSRYLNGVYYVPSLSSEIAPQYILKGKISRLHRAFRDYTSVLNNSIITCGDCASIPINSKCVDYIFTDPPFGANFAYAELNFLIESWHRVFTNIGHEAIESPSQGKSVVDYKEMMRSCFREYYRVLKPGRWITIVFSNNNNVVWHAIQESMGSVGFVVADVRTLDKKQGSFNQVAGVTVKQDLVISAYRPREELEARFELGEATIDDVWHFVREHLGNVPIFVGRSDIEADIVIERTPQMLHDRMIAFFVQRRVAVPISSSDFFMGLDQRYPKRDGMYFLPDQLSEYDRRRTTVKELRQLSLFVQDEASATQWIRQQLQSKPQTFQDLQPQFMQQLQAWAKHEKTVELKEILDLNFLCYDGEGSVPSQIHSYLSTNFKLLRNRDKDDRMLRAKAIDRWYVPDPRKDGDLQKLRIRAMLREFDQYRVSTQRRIRQFRTEAVRAGFKHCYDTQDYRTIVDVARKLPEQVVQEDEKLLMYYDVATMRLGDPEEA